MRDFRKGDEIKFAEEGSSLMNYGTVRVVRQKSCTVEVVDQVSGRVDVMCIPKRILNWN